MVLASIRFHSFIILFGMLFAIIGCDNANSELNDHFMRKHESHEVEVNNLVNALPSSAEISTILLESQIPFDESLTNDPHGADDYHSQTAMSFNLGIYAADLNYVTVYDKPDLVLKYLSAVYELAAALGAEGSVDLALYDKVQSSMGNKDTLSKLVFPIHQSIDKYLHENNQKDVSTMILAGAWVEGIYLTTMTLEKETQENSLLQQKLLEQKQPVAHIIEMLRHSVDNSKDVVNMMHWLKEVEAILRKDESGYEITSDDLVLIREKIVKIRSALI